MTDIRTTTSPPWRWMSPVTLVGDYGHRPVILTGRELHERDETGRLVTFDPKGPNGRLIAAAPKLLAFIERYYEAWKEYDDVNEETERMVADAKALIDGVRKP